MKFNSWKFESGIQPADLMAGLGAADNELLATCLALFDDSTLTARLGQMYERGSDQLGKWSGGHLAPRYESPRDEKLDNRLVGLPARRNMTLWT